MSQVTVEARVADSGVARVLEAVAALWGPLERLLFKKLYTVEPTLERIKEVKREFIREHGLSARQFNGMRMNLGGKVEAWRETQKELATQLGEGIRTLRKRLGRLETTRADLTQKLATFKPSRKLATAQALMDRRRRVAFQLHQKKRRLHHLELKAQAVEKASRGTPSICFGGRAVFRKQARLGANGFESHEAWRAAWRARRSSQFYAVGSKDETRGNGECQFHPETGELQLRLPKALEGRFGKHLRMTVAFHRPSDLVESLAQGRAISYRFLRREAGPWFVQASTMRDPAPVVTRKDLGVVGADLNEDHVAVAELDRFGNLAEHRRIPRLLQGLSTDQAEARIGDAVAELVLQAKAQEKPLVIEALDFRKKKAALRELGKPRARGLSGFAFAKFQEFAQSRCEREGVELIRVNPAFTSTLGYAKFGGYEISPHVAAAMAIGRRGQGFGERLAARSASPRLGGDLATRLREIAKGRRAGEHVWTFWRLLTPWLRSAMRKRRGPRSVQSGGASHPGGRGSPPVTVRSSGC